MYTLKILGYASLLLLAWTGVALAAPHWETTVTWTAPTTGGTVGEYELWRKIGATGTYASLGKFAPTVLTGNDAGPYSDGQVICYKVTARNATGGADSAETCEGAPVTAPGAPGAPRLQWRWIPQ